MRHEERATILVKTIRAFDTELTVDGDVDWAHTMEADDAVALLTAALREVERETWEKAAKFIEHERNSNCDYYEALTRSYLWCRQQAKEKS